MTTIKVKACCEKMEMMLAMCPVVTEEPRLEMSGPIGFGIEMDYCPWCGARIETVEEPKHRFTVTVRPQRVRIELDEPYDPESVDQHNKIVDQIVAAFSAEDCDYTVPDDILEEYYRRQED